MMTRLVKKAPAGSACAAILAILGIVISAAVGDASSSVAVPAASPPPAVSLAPAALSPISALSIAAEDAVPLSMYLEYARAAADSTYAGRDELLARWRETFDPLNVFGYRPPGNLLETAAIYSFLYEREKTPVYAERAKEILLTYGDYRSLYPESSIRMRSDYADGVPALPDFFTVMRYIRTLEILRRLGRLTPAEAAACEETVAESMRYLLRTQEWGAMNRAALRAESLAWAVRVLPDHPDTPVWEMQRRALGDDNWGVWEIEDAALYHGVWLYALLGYADALDRTGELFATPEMYYYAHYFLNLMSPAAMIPDFGDSHWTSNWPHFLVYFEAAAAAYGDPRLKWAAAVIARRFVDFAKPVSAGLGYMLLDACRWGRDGLAAEPPDALSGEVMEDVVGKKIVFRDGWSPRSTYALINYRDEGDGGLKDRDYLRDTIPVEEEKMTHGHADENSIVLLMADGSVLLHDGGYRDYMPSGPFGAYRQDYFHNRLCFRPEKIFFGQNAGESRYSVREAVAGQGVLEFMRNAGSYRRVRTQKIDFLTFEDFDYSRTRLIDDGWGAQADRVVVYLKEPGVFVVFDLFKALREDWFTLASFWHTRSVVDRGEGWFDTAYDRIQTHELPRTRNLLVAFPLAHYRFAGVEPLRRHAQDELAIHQVTAKHFELGGTEGLVTVLIPHPPDAPAADLAGMATALAVEPDGRAFGVRIETGGKTWFAGVKTDLRMDIARDWRRPRYTYEAGRIEVGPFETNGDFVCGRLSGGRLDWTAVNLTKVFYDGTPLFEAVENNFGLAFDGSPDSGGIGKVRYWRGSAEVK